MKDAWDIAAVSLPFTAGAAAGAALTAGGGVAEAAGGMAAGASLVAAVSLLVLVARRRTGLSPFIILFFILGCFCQLSAGMVPRASGAGPVGRMAAGALAALRGIIDSIPFPHDSTNALVTALLTGARGGLTAEQTAAFRASGAAHILALSGLHLGIIYLIVNKLLIVLGNSPFMRRLRSVIIIAFAGFYTLVTGAGPSIVRAFLFLFLRASCPFFPERRTGPARTLLTALTIQLVLKPDVITSVGFQLSYLAMSGILLLYPRLDSWFPDPSSENVQSPVAEADSNSIGTLFRAAWTVTVGRVLRRIWQSAALAVSCQVFTAPLVWIRFHSFPKYFILTNLIALPLTTALMASSVAAIFLQWLGGCPPLLIRLADALASALLFTLDVISSL